MNFQQKATLLAAALVSVAPVAAQAAIITLPDSGFETPVQSSPNYYSYYANNGTPGGSTVDGITYTYGGTGGSGIAADGSAFLKSGSNSMSAPEGTQVGFVQQSGQISMAFNYTGSTSSLFNFSFEAADRYLASTNETVKVLLNGVLIDTLSGLSNTAFAAFTTANSTLLDGTNTLVFQGVYVTNVDSTALIDAVTVNSVNRVPEPASIALLAAGLFGFGASRRKNAA